MRASCGNFTCYDETVAAYGMNYLFSRNQHRKLNPEDLKFDW